MRGENTSPRVCGMFYKAVVQVILLYGSETWCLSPALLARLEGFHIKAAYRMAREHRPGKDAHGVWIYPASKDVLEECGLFPMEEYIVRRRNSIAEYVATRPLLDTCREGNLLRGTPQRLWWWEQEFRLDVEPPI